MTSLRRSKGKQTVCSMKYYVIGKMVSGESVVLIVQVYYHKKVNSDFKYTRE